MTALSALVGAAILLSLQTLIWRYYFGIWWWQ